MPTFDVVANGTNQDLSFPEGTTTGQFRHTRENLTAGGGVTTVFTNSEDNPWDDITVADDDVTRFTLTRMNSGNVSPISTILVRDVVLSPSAPPDPDVTPPVVTWQSPQDGDTVSGLVDFHVTVDDDSEVPTVSLTIDGVAHTIGTAWDTTVLANDHVAELIYTATDA